MEYSNVNVGEKFLPDEAVEAIEKKIAKWEEFLVDSVLTTAESADGSCKFCGSILVYGKTKERYVAFALGRGNPYVDDTRILSTDICEHKFHAGCFINACREGKGRNTCPYPDCQAEFYTNINKVTSAVEIRRDLATMKLLASDTTLGQLVAVHRCDPEKIQMGSFSYCLLLAAYGIRSYKYSGFRARANDHFVVQTILNIMRHLHGDPAFAFEGPATVPAVQQPELTVARVLHNGEGNKEIRLAESLFGGGFARLWKTLVSAIGDKGHDGRDLVHPNGRIAALQFGAQVLALASKHYMLKMGQLEVLQKSKPGMWDWTDDLM
ncbi:hypothetical protein AC579_8473 [Pseudocercospora musae]|uniref:Uncharacterized protein n=1 Tax=Pseudocercospora musae TaxID=113226 RepID=A0A139I269_9PEZI|nr:hypothetical protein AC579_8473 [Pseudocercospora musae]